VDQRSPADRPIHAIASGTVKVARMFNIHGGTVGLDHGHGVTSAYLHMKRFAVDEGATVQKGDVIGYVGSTGRSTAPHLHWSLSVNGVQVNPRQWVALKPCGTRAILRSNGRNPRR
jgi:murein DD-endopeptidase MepM/ murein hydrolase activator NlpD